MNQLWTPRPPVFGNAHAAPDFGRPNCWRFRRIMDNLGVQYAEDNFTYTLDSLTLASGATFTGQIQFDHNTIFEWVQLTGGADNGDGTYSPAYDLTLTLQDSASSQALFNMPISLPTIAGANGTPFVLPITRRFMPSTYLNVTITNNRATSFNNVELSLKGRKLFMQSAPGVPERYLPKKFTQWQDVTTGQVYTEDLYFIDFYAPSVLSGTQLPVTNIMQNDSDFEWLMTTGTALNSAANNVFGNNVPLLVQVYDGSEQRNLYSTASQFGNVSGYGQFPLVEPQPRLFPKNNPVTVTFTNTSLSNVNHVHFVMIGRKIFEQN